MFTLILRSLHMGVREELKKKKKKTVKGMQIQTAFFFSPHNGCFSKRLASLVYGCVALRDDNGICWECGPLLYPPSVTVTTWSDGSG